MSSIKKLSLVALCLAGFGFGCDQAPADCEMGWDPGQVAAAQTCPVAGTVACQSVDVPGHTVPVAGCLVHLNAAGTGEAAKPYVAECVTSCE